MLNLEPDSAHRWVDETRLDDILQAFGDFADMKSPFTLGHARETARLVQAMSSHLGIISGQADATLLHRAAMTHDLGNAAIPTNILNKGSGLTEGEFERIRLHPYYTERILSRVPALQAIGRLAGAHHEWLNGQGYFRGMSGNQIPRFSRALVVAAEFELLCRAFPDRPALTAEKAIQQLWTHSGEKYDAECLAALANAVETTVPKSATRKSHPAGLSEREIEVLRLIAVGKINREIAGTLSISDRTVGHHVQHIYDKINVSTRAGATYFALQHGLV